MELKIFPSSKELIVSDRLVVISYLSGPIVAYVIMLLHYEVNTIPYFYPLFCTIGCLQTLALCIYLKSAVVRSVRTGPRLIELQESLLALIFIITTHAFYFWYTWCNDIKFHFYAGITLMLAFIGRASYGSIFGCQIIIKALENKQQVFELRDIIDRYKNSTGKLIEEQEKTVHKNRRNTLTEEAISKNISPGGCSNFVENMLGRNLVIDEIPATITAILIKYTRNREIIKNRLLHKVGYGQNSSISTKPDIGSKQIQRQNPSIDIEPITELKQRQNLVINIESTIDLTAELEELISLANDFSTQFDKELESWFNNPSRNLINFPFAGIKTKLEETITFSDELKQIKKEIPATTKDDEITLSIYQCAALFFNLIWGVVMGTAFYPYNTLEASVMYSAIYYYIRFIPMTRWTLKSMIYWGWDNLAVDFYINFGLTSECFPYEIWKSLYGSLCLSGSNISHLLGSLFQDSEHLRNN